MEDKNKIRIKKIIKKVAITFGIIFLAFVVLTVVVGVNSDKIEEWANDTTISTTIVTTTENKTTTTIKQTTETNTTTTELSTKITTTEKATETTTGNSYSYDNLQKVFLAITPKTTIKDVYSFIKRYDFCYSSKEYRGSKTTCYRLAYNDDVAKQSYGETGDSIEITFDTDGILKYAVYFNTKAFYSDDIYNAILYVSGTYWDFSENGMDGDYSGYYGHKQDFKNDDGITIKYKNGNSKKTDYYSFDSAISVINLIIDNGSK